MRKAPCIVYTHKHNIRQYMSIKFDCKKATTHYLCAVFAFLFVLLIRIYLLFSYKFLSSFSWHSQCNTFVCVCVYMFVREKNVKYVSQEKCTFLLFIVNLTMINYIYYIYIFYIRNKHFVVLQHERSQSFLHLLTHTHIFPFVNIHYVLLMVGKCDALVFRQHDIKIMDDAT